MEISFYIWMPEWHTLHSFIAMWLCIGSITLLPWSILRVQTRDRNYHQLMTARTAIIVMPLIMLMWPVMIAAMWRRVK